jgi:hypothetical protein
MDPIIALELVGIAGAGGGCITIATKMAVRKLIPLRTRESVSAATSKALAKMTEPARRPRIRNEGVRRSYMAWRAISATAAEEKAWREEQKTRRATERLEPRQRWAGAFEDLAHHTWNGPWEPALPIEEREKAYQGYYANKEHWAAMTDPQRHEHVRAQRPYSHRSEEKSDVEKRNIAIQAADAWRKAGAIDYRTEWLEDNQHRLEKNRIEHQLALEEKRKKRTMQKWASAVSDSKTQSLVEYAAMLQEEIDNERARNEELKASLKSLQLKAEILNDLDRSYAEAFNDVMATGDDGLIWPIGVSPRDRVEGA